MGDEVAVVCLLAEPYSFERVVYATHLNGRLHKPRTMFSFDTTLPDLCGGGLVVSPEGSGIRVVADSHDACESYVEPTWSPDGERVAFWATGAGGECGFNNFIGVIAQLYSALPFWAVVVPM